jgi:hypothetical protein
MAGQAGPAFGRKLVAAIRALVASALKTWMPGTRPGMTEFNVTT